MPFVHSTEFVVDVVIVVCLILWTQHGINHWVLSQGNSSIKHLWLKKYHSQMFPTDLMWSKTHKNGMWEDISCVRCGKQYRFIYFLFFWLLFLWFYGRDLLAIYEMDFHSTLFFPLFLFFYFMARISTRKK